MKDIPTRLPQESEKRCGQGRAKSATVERQPILKNSPRGWEARLRAIGIAGVFFRAQAPFPQSVVGRNAKAGIIQSIEFPQSNPLNHTAESENETAA